MNLCQIEGCERPLVARGWCRNHYWRWRRTGDPGPVELFIPTHICTIEGCEDKHVGKGYCNRHLKRFHEHGDPQAPPAYKRGPERHNWNDAPGYRLAHIRVGRAKGKASEHDCAECGATAEQWSYNHQDPAAFVDRHGPYSGDPQFYDPLCAPCHKRRDAA